MSRIVIALGGNALGNSSQEQQEKIAQAAPALIELVKAGHELVLSHGNGPQVGMIKLAFDLSSAQDSNIAAMELADCTAMSQGYIGFHLQKGLQKQLQIAGLTNPVVSVVTQVVVDAEDGAFKNPTKPIGAFYTQEQAEQEMLKSPAKTFAQDAGRGWRQMVASPKPIDIVEKESIISLIKSGNIVIACGGGGVPVVELSKKDYKGVSAVIDKDFASAKLAQIIEADMLFILTAVDRVSINWGKENQQEITQMTIEQAEKYCGEGHFAPGSMLPKVQAAMSFASTGKDKKAVIASLEKVALALEGTSGTVIIK